MPIEEITTESWGSRIKSSFGGFVVGPLLIIAAVPILFKNEGCAVQSYQSIAEVADTVVSVPADEVRPTNEGRLVHVTGHAETKDMLEDPIFGVSATGIELVREVEMFQLAQKERRDTQTQTGGSKTTKVTYTYEETWSSDHLDSSSYKDTNKRDVNPPMKYQGTEVQAANVTLGAFRLSEALIDQITGGERLPVDEKVLNRLPASEQAKAQISSGVLYLGLGGGSPGSPQIGDYKISYRLVKPGDVSVVATQIGESFAPYRAEAGDPILWLRSGILDVKEMVHGAEGEVSARTWIIRFAGFLMFLIGFTMLFRPLAVLGDVIPLVGTIIGGAGFFVALVLSASLSLLIISLAWIFYRPLVAIPMLLLVVGGFAFLFLRAKKKLAVNEAGAG